jgi:acyl-CoA oxidase
MCTHTYTTHTGLKSLVTRITLEGMETCRQTLGGHGFLKIAGLSDMASTYAGLVTAEGENF